MEVLTINSVDLTVNLVDLVEEVVDFLDLMIALGDQEVTISVTKTGLVTMTDFQALTKI